MQFKAARSKYGNKKPENGKKCSFNMFSNKNFVKGR